MRGNNRQIHLNYDRKKEYLRQQERLKAMACTPDKVESISADLMVENLLRDSSHMSSQNERSDPFCSELPTWLQCESPTVPAEYKYLWSLVQSSSNLADTQKVSQLLLTSGLHVDVLGYIWNLANKTIPGQLTKQEFFIVLALVNLAQRGSSFNNLSILKLISAPVIPVLQVNFPKKHLPMPETFSSTNAFRLNVNHHLNAFQNISKSDYATSKLRSCTNENECKSISNTNCQPTSAFNYNNQRDFTVKLEKSERNIERGNCGLTVPNEYPATYNEFHKNSNFPCIGSSPTKELEDDFSEFQSVVPNQADGLQGVNAAEPCDEFTDFQSANSETLNELDPFETIVISQKREIPKIPLPKSLAGKINSLKSNILKISPESERKLKVLSPNESLSSLPESKISSTNKVFTSISVLGGNREIGSRLANHSLSIKPCRTKLHKHHKNKQSPGSSTKSNEEEIIFGVKTKNLESTIPKCSLKKSTFILKETKIKDNEISEVIANQVGTELNSSVICSGENTRKIEIPMLGTFNETVLPTQTKSQTPCTDLISVEEDKYRALREIEMEMSQIKTEIPISSEEVNDEFGDFLSADILSPPAPPQETSLNESKVSSDLLLESEDKENWGEWSFNTEINSSLISELNSSEGNDRGNEKEEISRRATESNFDAFNLLCLEDEKSAIPSYSADQAPIQNDFVKSDSTVINLLPLDSETLNNNTGKDFESGKINFELLKPPPPSVTNNQPENELWDFFIPPAEPATSNLSRHNSLPSLDFKMSPCDESDQDVIWRKCLESCQNIIQEGVEIFDRIVKKAVLEEVLASPKTSDYLNNLKIAYQISKRISQNLSYSFPEQEELDRMWERLEKLCSEYNVKIKSDADTVSEGKNSCTICFGYIGNDFINQGDQNYHPSCANLWINCVEESLPCPS